MEEILASIRRIIEDNDAAPPAGKAVPSRAPEPAPEKPAERMPVEGLRRETAAWQGDRPAAGSEIETFRAAFDRQPDEEAAAAGEPAANLRSEPDDEPAPDLPPDLPMEAALSAAASEDGQAGAPVPSEARPGGILSEYAGRKVAAAFGELNEAFEASRRRQFDQVAEEMLRPMLQEWLDNNLPTLVERLVREEIERIARGG
ncbi:DUF2497 domain-containing protein [Nitratireductor sp. ZSWI3]|nr:DUF2497 domain-containing protein [Nitratireductor sp. ZSWI3]